MLKNIISIGEYTVFLTQDSVYYKGKFIISFSELKNRIITKLPTITEKFVLKKELLSIPDPMKYHQPPLIKKTIGWDALLGELITTGQIKEVI